MTRLIPLVLILASLVNVLPFTFYSIGGDVLVHLASIHCFGSQFWAGDLFPRWCFEADAGLGSPLLLFYFPLPYYVTALFYPLHQLIGMPIEGIYTLGVFLATLATAFTTYRWLTDITGEGRALLCAVILLFMPYRMELMLFRSAYGELWCMAFLPLIFQGVRRIAQHRRSGARTITIPLTLALLSNVPATVCAMIGAALYLLFAAEHKVTALLRFSFGAALGVALTFFYALPAAYYSPYIMNGMHHATSAPWANRFIQPLKEISEGRTQLIVGMGITAVLFAMLTFMVFLRRFWIRNLFARKETTAWIIAGILSVALMLPISAPIWKLINIAAPIGFPWRMQLFFTFAVIYLIALYTRWLLSERQLRTWKTDAALLLGFLVLVSQFMVAMYSPGQEKEIQRLIDARYIAYQEYRTRWTSPQHYTRSLVMQRFDAGENAPRTEFIKGGGGVRIDRWGAGGIELFVSADSASRIRVYHRYFPIWQQVRDGKVALITPEDGSGFMLLDVPPGEHRIVLSTENNLSILLEIFHHLLR